MTASITQQRRVVSLGAGLLVLLFLTALTAASYGYILSLGFTATDTLTLIRDSRIREWHDVGAILGRGIMGGEFYRPVAQFSYSFDYAQSKLDPGGYHLTDLLLQVTAVLLVALLIRQWHRRGGWLGAGLGATSFALHPILLETVPAIARRHDMLAAVFGLVALVAYDRVWRGVRIWFAVALALLMTTLAIGSKEIGVIIPALIIADIWLIQWREDGRRTKQAIVYTILWAGLTIGLLFWRQSRQASGIDLLYFWQHSDNFWLITQTYFSGLLLAAQGVSRLTAVFCLLGLVGIGLWAWYRRQRLILLASLWLLGTWGMLVVSGRADLRNLYLPAIGLGVLWGCFVMMSVQAVRQQHLRARLTRAIILGILLFIGARVLRASPLLVAYPGWPTAGRVTTLVLEETERLASLLPPEATLYVLHLPSHIAASPDRFHEQSVSVMRDHSIQSWLTMRAPELRTQVQVCDYRHLESGSVSPPPLISYLYGDTAVIVVATKADEVAVPWQYVWPDACQTQLPAREASLRREMPPDATLLKAQLGPSINLVGYRLSVTDEVQNGVALMLYWQATKAVPASYTVFVHLMNEQGELIAQRDSLPVNGTWPTTEWPAGELIADGYQILLPDSVPPGRYQLEVGMYDANTLERLPVFVDDDVDDAVMLDSLIIP